MTGFQIFLLFIAVSFVLVLFVRLIYRVWLIEKILREARNRLSEPQYE